MGISEAQKRAIDKYKKANYDFIKVRLNKGEKEILQEKAKAEGLSVNEYIRSKIL